MSDSNLSSPITATDVRDRLRSAGHEVEIGDVLRLARSDKVKAAKDGGAWMFEGLDFNAERYVEKLADLDAPGGQPDAPDSLSDRLDGAQEQGRKQGERESSGGSLEDLRSGDGLSNMGGRL